MKKFNLLCFIIFSLTKLTYATDVKPVINFDSSRYLGTWYEIARLPNRFEDKCIAPITANYSINPDNKNELIIINKCNTQDNKPDSASGIASFVEAPTVGKLKVTFLPTWLRWLPFGSGDYWILSTDYTNISIVGSPDHNYLWILARSDKIDKHILEDYALPAAKKQGYDISQLIFNYSTDK